MRIFDLPGRVQERRQVGAGEPAVLACLPRASHAHMAGPQEHVPGVPLRPAGRAPARPDGGGAASHAKAGRPAVGEAGGLMSQE